MYAILKQKIYDKASIVLLSSNISSLTLILNEQRYYLHSRFFPTTVSEIENIGNLCLRIWCQKSRL